MVSGQPGVHTADVPPLVATEHTVVQGPVILITGMTLLFDVFDK